MKMKQLITLIGPNGVGKSTTAKRMVVQGTKIACVDAEWCRVMNPFAFNDATKQTVLENICCLLRNYLICEDINTVVFPYSWHGGRKEIYEKVMEKLRNDSIDFRETIIILKCSRDENIKRALADGRDETRINRGMEMTFSVYDEYDYPCIDITDMTPSQVAQEISSLTNCS